MDYINLLALQANSSSTSSSSSSSCSSSSSSNILFKHGKSSVKLYKIKTKTIYIEFTTALHGCRMGIR